MRYPVVEKAYSANSPFGEDPLTAHRDVDAHAVGLVVDLEARNEVREFIKRDGAGGVAEGGAVDEADRKGDLLHRGTHPRRGDDDVHRVRILERIHALELALSGREDQQRGEG